MMSTAEIERALRSFAESEEILPTDTFEWLASQSGLQEFNALFKRADVASLFFNRWPPKKMRWGDWDDDDEDHQSGLRCTIEAWPDDVLRAFVHFGGSPPPLDVRMSAARVRTLIDLAGRPKTRRAHPDSSADGGRRRSALSSCRAGAVRLY